MKLSFSTLNMLHTNSHCWLNRLAGVERVDYWFYKEGREAHRIIQDHVSGVSKHRYLSHIDIHFPIVETKDFDPKTKFEFEFEGYTIIGYYDGIDYKNNRFLEIKTSNKLWSLGKFKKAMQRKLYGLANPELKTSILITGSRKIEDWKEIPPRVYTVPVTKKDLEEVKEWIREGIKILEAGKFDGGLVDGKCVDPYCPYGQNCLFK